MICFRALCKSISIIQSKEEIFQFDDILTSSKNCLLWYLPVVKSASIVTSEINTHKTFSTQKFSS